MSHIVLMTDFGQLDGYVGVMKGVIADIAPQAQVIDLTHNLAPQDLNAARFVLWNSYRYFPKRSIFVAVVDPGVGSQRHILMLDTGQHIFIAPDNGLLDYILAENRVKHLLRIEEPKVMRSSISHTFHGRDIFAPAAAHLAAGYPLTMVGPMHPYHLPPSPFQALTPPETEGRIIHVDHFGNLISNLRFPAAEARGRVNLGAHQIAVHPTYAAVAEGQPLALPGSHGLLEIAVRNGHAARALDAQVGQIIRWSD